MKTAYTKALICFIVGILIAYSNVLGQHGTTLILVIHFALHIWGFLYFVTQALSRDKIFNKINIAWVLRLKEQVINSFSVLLPIVGFTSGFSTIFQYNKTQDWFVILPAASMLLILIATDATKHLNKEQN